MRRPIDSKSDTCTESRDVDAAGISGKVDAPIPGEICRLGTVPAIVERRSDEPAEVSRGHSSSGDRNEGPNT
jgi:hypothetical protein